MKKEILVPFVMQQLLYFFCWPLMRFFTRVSVIGAEHVAHMNRNFILASNHVAEIDAAYVRAALPMFSRHAPLYYTSNTKDKFNKNKYGWRAFIYGGSLFRTFGAYPVYKGQHDYAVALQHHINLLKLKKTVAIFPEGKLSLDGSLGEGRGGIAYLSHTLDIPVVPIAIIGLFGITVKEFFLRKRKVVVHIGKAILPRSIVSAPLPSFEDYKKGSELILSHIKGLMETSATESSLESLAPTRAEKLPNLVNSKTI